MTRHAELSGSSAHRWMRCPGCIRLLRQVPRGSSAAARQGTMAHALGEQMLDYHNQSGEGPNGIRARFRPTKAFKYVDHDVCETGEVDQEMIDHVMVYVEYVLKHRGQKHLEVHVDLAKLVRPRMFGTTDCLIDEKDTLVVIDFKYGFTPVRVWDDDHGPNEQLLYYAAGALELFKWRHKKVRLVIVQPRCMEVDPVQEYTLPAADVKNWAQTDLLEAAHAVDEPDAPLVAGEHCRFCDAQAICPKIQEEANNLAMTDFLDDSARPTVPEKPVDLARVLRAAPMIDSWLRACEEAAFVALQSGQKVPGFKLVRKRANREWPEGISMLELAKRLGIPKDRARDVFEPPAFRSPKQMEAVVDKKVVNQVAVKPEGGLTVAAESDKRDAVDPVGDFEDIL